MSDSVFNFDLYLAPHRFSAEWCRHLLQGLWQHGLRLHQSPNVPATWEAQLASVDYQAAGVRLEERNRHRIAIPIFKKDRSLDEAINELAQEGYAFFSLWDNQLQLGLTLDPNGILESTNAARLGEVRLNINGSFFEPYATQTADSTTLMSMHLQAWQAFLHWGELLCQRIEPRYAIGYGTERTMRNETFLTAGIAALKATLAQGKFPFAESWIDQGGIQYIAPAFSGDGALVARYLDQPGFSLKRLPNGGLLVIPPTPPFFYESSEALRQVMQGEWAFNSLFNRAETVAALNDPAARAQTHDAPTATQHLQRALTIFETLHDATESERIRNDLARIRQFRVPT